MVRLSISNRSEKSRYELNTTDYCDLSCTYIIYEIARARTEEYVHMDREQNSSDMSRRTEI